MDRMRSAGLDRVEELRVGAPAVRGFLQGEDEQSVLLFAGCGSGAEASRRAALVAAADLARTPRRHTLELVLCTAGGAGPEAARRTAEGWLDLRLAGTRDTVLAALHLQAGERRGASGVGLLLAADTPGGRRLPPAWLAHAALAGARADGGGLRIGDRRWPLMGQLLGRYGRLRMTSGAEPFLAAGVPAMTVDVGTAPGWPSVVASIVRRLDSLAGRPRGDDVYVALGRRIWTRRDLYWAGLAIWVPLVVRGRPGAWRGAGSSQRRRRGRRYLPGFIFRILLLALLLTAPVATLVLVAPASLLTLASPRRRLAVNVARVLAATPGLIFAGYWVQSFLAGQAAAWPAQPLRLALVLSCIGLALSLIGRRPRDRSGQQTGVAGS
jgi:hypothetical protein